MPGFTFFKPHPAVADIVETIWDADLPDPNLVGAIAIKLLPTVSPVLCVHYRPPTATNQWANTHHRQRLAGIHTSAITLRPRGPLGCVVAHLKPDAASLLMGGRMDEFTDANIGVCDVLSPTRASELEEMLVEAANASERAERMQAFLLAQVREATPDLIVRQAVLLLRRNPRLSVRQVAKSLDISERPARAPLLCWGRYKPKTIRAYRANGEGSHRAPAWRRLGRNRLRMRVHGSSSSCQRLQVDGAESTGSLLSHSLCYGMPSTKCLTRGCVGFLQYICCLAR
jgi:hypothetical protein